MPFIHPESFSHSLPTQHRLVFQHKLAANILCGNEPDEFPFVCGNTNSTKVSYGFVQLHAILACICKRSLDSHESYLEVTFY